MTGDAQLELVRCAHDRVERTLGHGVVHLYEVDLLCREEAHRGLGALDRVDEQRHLRPERRDPIEDRPGDEDARPGAPTFSDVAAQQHGAREAAARVAHRRDAEREVHRQQPG